MRVSIAILIDHTYILLSHFGSFYIKTPVGIFFIITTQITNNFIFTFPATMTYHALARQGRYIARKIRNQQPITSLIIHVVTVKKEKLFTTRRYHDMINFMKCSAELILKFMIDNGFQAQQKL
ncbi:hypothetical protein C9J49_007325 [Halomonas sp. SL1]|nr:hypothetical protein C9J49_007325 [Halomonas sp. SL1]